MGKKQYFTSNIAQNQQSVSAYLYPIVPALYPLQEILNDSPQLCPWGNNNNYSKKMSDCYNKSSSSAWLTAAQRLFTHSLM